ncbi:5376_t:CDS:10, partial [Ambispora gerdemannii]
HLRAADEGENSSLTRLTETVLQKAFDIGFEDADNYLEELKNCLASCYQKSDTFYNYLTVIQSSGYGKTRTSDNMLKAIMSGTSIDHCHKIAKTWIESIITTYEKMNPQNPRDLLKDQEAFWDAVVSNISMSIPATFTRAKKQITIFVDEASALLERNTAFRAFRRALRDYNDSVFAILTDTCSAVADLAPWLERDPSARHYGYRVYKPFIYVATTDCLMDHPDVPLEDGSGHHIVGYGRPLWASSWIGYDKKQNPSAMFSNILNLAKTKLLGGGAHTWADLKKNSTDMIQTSALAIIASTADLYVSPISSAAPDMVRSHTATLISIDDERKLHLVAYPSEPMLSEAAMELLSEDDAEFDILTELDSATRHGDVILCSSTSLEYLSVLIKNFPREKFSQLKGFRIGFTHFFTLFHEPDEETIQEMYNRNAAAAFKMGAEGGDLIVPMILETNTPLDQERKKETWCGEREPYCCRCSDRVYMELT